MTGAQSTELNMVDSHIKTTTETVSECLVPVKSVIMSAKMQLFCYITKIPV